MSRLLRVSRLLLLVATAGYAATGTGFASFKIGIGSREWGMGNAGTAAAQGPMALGWNPALTARAENFGACFSYVRWFQDMQKSGLFVVRPARYLVLGLGVTAFSAGRLEYRTDQPTEEPLGFYQPVDYGLYLNLSRQLAPKVAAGLSGRYYYERIQDLSAASLGADAGLEVAALPNLRFGLALLDFGSAARFRVMDFTLPTRSSIGLSYRPELTKPLAAELTGDLGYGFYDRRVFLNLGAELIYNQLLALRFGYRGLKQEKGLTGGVGFRVRGFRLEYSFGLHELNLGATHRWAFGFGY